MKLSKLSRLGPYLLLGARVKAVVHGQLEHLAEVGLPFRGMTCLVGHVAAHTRPDTGAPGLLNGHMPHPFRVPPEMQGPFDHDVGIDELGHADTGCDDSRGLFRSSLPGVF